MRYYRVTCKHGHCGRGRYNQISFVFVANDAIDAMDRAKAMPGVKHTAPIISCLEISCAEYIEYRKISAYKRMSHCNKNDE